MQGKSNTVIDMSFKLMAVRLHSSQIKCTRSNWGGMYTQVSFSCLVFGTFSVIIVLLFVLIIFRFTTFAFSYSFYTISFCCSLSFHLTWLVLSSSVPFTKGLFLSPLHINGVLVSTVSGAAFCVPNPVRAASKFDQSQCLYAWPIYHLPEATFLTSSGFSPHLSWRGSQISISFSSLFEIVFNFGSHYLAPVYIRAFSFIPASFQLKYSSISLTQLLFPRSQRINWYRLSFLLNFYWPYIFFAVGWKELSLDAHYHDPNQNGPSFFSVHMNSISFATYLTIY